MKFTEQDLAKLGLKQTASGTYKKEKRVTDGVIWIKPMSVNDAWQGRRFKTKKYKDYERTVKSLLPVIDNIQTPIELHLEFGFSSKLQDADNPVKLIGDILQKKYGFNDRDIYKYIIEKRIVKKGYEYIKFKFLKYEKPDYL